MEVHASPAVPGAWAGRGPSQMAAEQWQGTAGQGRLPHPSVGHGKLSSPGSSDYALYEDTVSICCLYLSASKIQFILMR